MLWSIGHDPGGAAALDAEGDLLITGAKDGGRGAGAPWLYDDVGIRGDTITPVDLPRKPTPRCASTPGMVVAPGFIDVH